MRLFIFLLLSVFMLTSSVQAEDKTDKKTTTLPEVKVKASRKHKTSLTVPDLEQARKELDLIPGAVNLVSAESYETGRSSNLQDMLSYAAGVYAQSRFGSEETRLSIRGSGIQRTFHLRGIMMLQDGIPINEADGGGDFQNIEPLALKYVEVYRGSDALQYGATTLGGAINYVSPTGYDANKLQGRMEYGSFGYLHSQASSGAVIGPFDYYISLTQFRQTGFRNHANQNNGRLFSNYGWRINENIETRMYVTLVDTKSKLPGNLTKGQMKQNPKQPNPANLALNQKRDYDYVRVGNKTTFRFSEHQKLEASVFWFRKDLHHPIFQVIDVVSNNIGNTFRYLNDHPVFGLRNIFTLGFNQIYGSAHNMRFLNIGGSNGAQTENNRQTSYNITIYAQEQLFIFPNFSLVGGLQGIMTSRKNEDKFSTDGDHNAHYTYNSVSPKAGFLYEVTPYSQFYGNFNRSYEPPSFGELTNLAGGGVRDLSAQSAYTLEFGTRGHTKRIDWDVAYYYSWVDDEFLSLNNGAGTPLGTINADRTRHQGVEIGTSVDLLRGILSKNWHNEEIGFDRIRLQGMFNWGLFKFHNDPVYSNNTLPGLPEFFTRAELLYEHPIGIYVGPTMEWSLKKYPVDMANTLFTYPYALLGIKGGYRVKKGLSFFVEGRNLTNQTYAATTGVIADAFSRDSAQFLPGDGRSVYGGVEWRWG